MNTDRRKVLGIVPVLAVALSFSGTIPAVSGEGDLAGIEGLSTNVTGTDFTKKGANCVKNIEFSKLAIAKN